MPYHHIDPIAFSIGPIAIHWYGIAYVLGIIGWWRYSMWVCTKTGLLSAKAIDDFIPWAVVGIILGGRLGHVLFYGSSYYLEHPLEILMVWKGGMSFHGALLGITASILLYTRHLHIPAFLFSDMAVGGIPIGLFFGRIANFINGELYGRVTDVPWAMEFPSGGPLLRHPSQLYEALGEGLLLFILLYIATFWLKWSHKRFALTGLFLTGYGTIRFALEYFREPEPSFLGTGWEIFSAGQMLSLPLICVGLLLVFLSFRKEQS